MMYRRTTVLLCFTKGTSVISSHATSCSNINGTQQEAINIANTSGSQPSGYLEEVDLYYESSDNEIEIPATSDCDNTQSPTHTGADTQSPQEKQHTCNATPMNMKMTYQNIPFGHVCDDIAIDNDTLYVRLYCQNVNGIFDREGIGLDTSFKEIKQAGADIFTFNETHGDESNAVARRALRLSKQRMWRNNN
jgi:hypothetical protein